MNCIIYTNVAAIELQKKLSAQLSGTQQSHLTPPMTALAYKTKKNKMDNNKSASITDFEDGGGVKTVELTEPISDNEDDMDQEIEMLNNMTTTNNNNDEDDGKYHSPQSTEINTIGSKLKATFMALSTATKSKSKSEQYRELEPNLSSPVSDEILDVVENINTAKINSGENDDNYNNNVIIVYDVLIIRPKK